MDEQAGGDGWIADRCLTGDGSLFFSFTHPRKHLSCISSSVLSLLPFPLIHQSSNACIDRLWICMSSLACVYKGNRGKRMQMGPFIPNHRSLAPASMACKLATGLGQGGGGEGVVVTGGGDDDDGGDRYSEAASGFSSGSSVSSLTDDEDEVMSSAPPGRGDHRRASYSSSSSSSDTVQMDEDGGPLYELTPLLEHLPVRTGLSKYYQGKSQSFTSLSDAKCPEDLAKKTTPYITRMKLQRGYAAPGICADRSSSSRHVPGPCSKTIAKKAPRWSSDHLLLRTRTTSLLHSSSKPPAYQSKKELSRC